MARKRNGLWSKGAKRGWSAWCMGTTLPADAGAQAGGVHHDRCHLPTCPCGCHRKRLGRARFLDDGALLITCYECRRASRYRNLSRNGMARSQQLLARGWVNSSWMPGRFSGGWRTRWRHLACDSPEETWPT